MKGKKMIIGCGHIFRAEREEESCYREVIRQRYKVRSTKQMTQKRGKKSSTRTLIQIRGNFSNPRGGGRRKDLCLPERTGFIYDGRKKIRTKR